MPLPAGVIRRTGRHGRKAGFMMSGSLFLDLSGPWQFFMGPAESAVFGRETVLLPGTMDENRKGLDNRANFTSRHLNRDYTYTGPAVYRRKFTVPAEWAGSRTATPRTSGCAPSPPGRTRAGGSFSSTGSLPSSGGEINCAIFPRTGYVPMGLEDWL